jgi:hypothetical protein
MSLTRIKGNDCLYSLVMSVEDTLMRKTPFSIVKAVKTDGDERVWMQYSVR